MAQRRISVEDIAAAERLAGVCYSPEERELMREGLESQLAAARARRSTRLDADLPMASRFDPRPPGFVMPGQPPSAVVERPDPGPLPDDEAAIAFAPLWRLSAWLERGALGSRRLAEIYLDRIGRFDGRLESFVTLTPETARAQADDADRRREAGDRRGPLDGVPYGLKDLFDTAGTPTSWGAEPYRGRVPKRDARVTAMLREAGAVLLGKTSLGALAKGDVWFGGVTRNPWSPEEGASGSSAGSAAAVAAGLCGFAIGSETLGSITSPAQRCGVAGLRPTFGRVSRAGAMTLCWSLDKVGPLCRSVEDCGLVLEALNGPDPMDRGSIAAPFAFDPNADLAGLRLGWLPAAFEGEGATAVERAALAAARGLAAEVREARLPDLPYDSLVGILSAEAAAAFEELTLTGRDDLLRRQDADAWPNAFRRARFLSAVDHVQLDRLRYRVMGALDELFREIDVLIGPFATGPMLVASNFTGHPCLHLRAGFLRSAARTDSTIAGGGPRAGAGDEAVREVPHGISLWSGLFDEGRLCRFGMALEAALGVGARRPEGFD